MKKLVVCAVFALGMMSFTFSSEKTEEKAPCGLVFSICDEEATSYQEEYDISDSDTHDWFDGCMSTNGC